MKPETYRAALNGCVKMTTLYAATACGPALTGLWEACLRLRMPWGRLDRRDVAVEEIFEMLDRLDEVDVPEAGP